MPYVGVVVEIGEHELKVKWFDKERSVDMCTTTSVQAASVEVPLDGK